MIDRKLFRDLTNLEFLWLNMNNLVEINDDTFSNLTNLKYLNLESNNITHISENALDSLVNLEKICLFDNPIIAQSWDYVLNLCNSKKCKVHLQQDCFPSLRSPIYVFYECPPTTYSTTTKAQSILSVLKNSVV